MSNLSSQQERFFKELPASWQEPLKNVCSRKEIDDLLTFLKQQEDAGVSIYPEKANICAALKATHYADVRVIIIGQDPYHGPGQAHGLSFSVPEGVPIPPSLKNIYKELHADLGKTKPVHGNLSCWAQQGVLLLNSVLTVESGKAGSHAKKGWELFTDAVLAELLKQKKPLVCMLWGAYAQNKLDTLGAQLINPDIHCILKAAHPSPLSVRGFVGCRHFPQANNFLIKHNLSAINW